MSQLEDLLAFQLKAAKIKYEREYRFHPIRRWRFDFAFPDKRVAAECDGGIFVGGRHARGVGIAGDMDKFNAALALGWKPYRFSSKHIKSGEALAILSQALQGQSK